MHHNPAKNVLHLDQTLEELAAEADRSVDDLRQVVDAARRALLAARAARTTPFIDRTLYTGWNSMAVTACLETARVLGRDGTREFALRTLNRLLGEAWDGAQSLGHVIAYGDVQGEGAQPGEKAPGTLDDYAFTVHACVDAWFSTGEMSYYHAAVKLADAMIARFYDRQAGAFFDAATPADGVAPLGALAARRKPLQDTPTPAGNPTAASALLRLEALSGRREYREIAEETLASLPESWSTSASMPALTGWLWSGYCSTGAGCGNRFRSSAERLVARGVARFAVNKNRDAHRSGTAGSTAHSRGAGRSPASSSKASRCGSLGDRLPRTHLPSAGHSCRGA